MKSLVVVFVLALGLSACASNRVIVDTKGVDTTRYNDDLRECQEYAGLVPVGEEVAREATRGGLVWGAIGAIFGRSRGAARGAGAGAVAGGARGAAKAEREKQQVVKTCLRGRGYKVLN